MSAALIGLSFMMPPARADDCDRPPAPQIFVETQIESIGLNTRRSTAELRDLWQEGSATSPNGLADTMHLLGLYSAQHGAWTSVEFQSLTNHRDQSCLAITKITVEVRLRDREIFIANMLPRGSCTYQTVLDHEHQHAAISEDVIQDTVETLERMLPSAAGSMTSLDRFPADQMDRRVDSIAESVSELASEVLADAMDSGAVHHAALDSPAQRERERDRCGDEFSEILQGMR